MQQHSCGIFLDKQWPHLPELLWQMQIHEDGSKGNSESTRDRGSRLGEASIYLFFSTLLSQKYIILESESDLKLGVQHVPLKLFRLCRKRIAYLNYQIKLTRHYELWPFFSPKHYG